MSANSSLDFLNMIKTPSNVPGTKVTKAVQTVQTVQGAESLEEQTASDLAKDMIAVIDTETNWRDEVMSLGVALADAKTYTLLDKRYYIFDPECRVGGMYSGVMYKTGVKAITCGRDEAMVDIGQNLTLDTCQNFAVLNGLIS